MRHNEMQEIKNIMIMNDTPLTTIHDQMIRDSVMKTHHDVEEDERDVDV